MSSGEVEKDEDGREEKATLKADSIDHHPAEQSVLSSFASCGSGLLFRKAGPPTMTPLLSIEVGEVHEEEPLSLTPQLFSVFPSYFTRLLPFARSSDKSGVGPTKSPRATEEKSITPGTKERNNNNGVRSRSARGRPSDSPQSPTQPPTPSNRSVAATPTAKGGGVERRKGGDYTTILFDTTPILPAYALFVCLGHVVPYCPSYIENLARGERIGFVGLEGGQREGETVNAGGGKEGQIGSDGDRDGMTDRQSTDDVVAVRAQLFNCSDVRECDYSLYVAQRCMQVLQSKWKDAPYPIRKLDLMPLAVHRWVKWNGCVE